MKLIKQKRNKKGQYKRKHKSLALHLFLFSSVVWTVNVIDYQNLEPQRWVIAQTNNNYPIRLDVSNTPNSALSTTTVGTDDGGVASPSGVASPDGSGAPLSSDIEGMIRRAFPEDPHTAVAIAKAESRLKTDSKGWNCYYNGRSQACRVEDRESAWSVDCGVMQINVIGKECPKELFDPTHNIEVGRKKYEGRNFTFLAWSAYKNQSYLKYL